MSVWQQFWADETGAVASAELVTVATVAVAGGTVGLNLVTQATKDEFRELSHAVRSLNQSYMFAGYSSCRAWTAGSCYTQPDVRRSIADLDAAFVGDSIHTPSELRRGGDSPAPRREHDEVTFAVPDESSLGEPDFVAPDDDAAKVETTIEPSVE